MNEKEKVDLFSKVDFGDIDANADPNLDKYFIDNGYWNSIIDSPIYYVIGKKGTGKSALYKMLEKMRLLMAFLYLIAILEIFLLIN